MKVKVSKPTPERDMNGAVLFELPDVDFYFMTDYSIDDDDQEDPKCKISLEKKHGTFKIIVIGDNMRNIWPFGFPDESSDGKICIVNPEDGCDYLKFEKAWQEICDSFGIEELEQEDE